MRNNPNPNKLPPYLQVFQRVMFSTGYTLAIKEVMQFLNSNSKMSSLELIKRLRELLKEMADNSDTVFKETEAEVHRKGEES